MVGFRIVPLIFTVAALGGACGGAPSAPTSAPNGATLTVTVVSGAVPIASIGVTLAGPVPAHAATDAFGKATFQNLPSGNYTVAVHGFGIEDATSAISVGASAVQTTLDVRYKNDVALASTPKECGTTVSSNLSISVPVDYRLAFPVPGHGAGLRYGLSEDGVTFIQDRSGWTTSDLFAFSSRATAFIQASATTIAHFIIVQLIAADFDRFNVNVISVLATQVTPCELKGTP